LGKVRRPFPNYSKKANEINAKNGVQEDEQSSCSFARSAIIPGSHEGRIRRFGGKSRRLSSAANTLIEKSAI
jgi:hypothetical protein